MTCIHGLDEINCPTCRILKSAIPLRGIKLSKLAFPKINDFRNELFLERSKDLDITKEDNYGITKKIPLESPEWKFEEED